MRHMRPFGSSEQLTARRKRALQWLRRKSSQQVAKRMGVTARSVRRWRQEAKQPKRKTKVRSPGRRCCLSAAQLRRLEQVLPRGARAQGYADEYWTLDRIAHVVWHLFRVRYHSSSVWHLLQRMGWSSQLPQRRTFARDEKAIAHWKHYIWPQIKKVA